MTSTIDRRISGAGIGDADMPACRSLGAGEPKRAHRPIEDTDPASVAGQVRDLLATAVGDI